MAMEAMSGFSLADVVVHRNSAEPARLGAFAFAQGNRIHMAPGQERHLPHEAWHVVQQKQGRVRPTLQLQGGAFVNDDAGLEREADLFGTKAQASIATAQSADSAALPQGGIAPVQRRISGAVIQAALVNPVYAGGTKPTNVNLVLGAKDWPPYGSAPGEAPDGWQEIVDLGLTGHWCRFHVLNQDAGGAGVANNLVPTTRQVNQCATWKGFEKWVKLYSQPGLAGVGMPFASTFNADVAYHTAGDDCVYQNGANGKQIPVRGVDFPAVIAATLTVPAQPGFAAKQYAGTLGHGDGLIRPNQFAPAGWFLAAPPAAPAAAAAPPVAAAAPAAAAAAPAAVPLH